MDLHTTPGIPVEPALDTLAAQEEEAATPSSVSHLIHQYGQALPSLALLVIGFLEAVPDPTSGVGIGCGS